MLSLANQQNIITRVINTLPFWDWIKSREQIKYENTLGTWMTQNNQLHISLNTFFLNFFIVFFLWQASLQLNWAPVSEFYLPPAFLLKLVPTFLHHGEIVVCREMNERWRFPYPSYPIIYSLRCDLRLKKFLYHFTIPCLDIRPFWSLTKMLFPKH